MPTSTRRNFRSRMPVHPIRQKHGNPKTEDNYGFLRSLNGNDGADVNARVVWVDHRKHTKASGCRIVALHGETAASNGYGHIVRADGKVHKMTREELHRPLSKWDAGDVLQRWRRGPSIRSARPRTVRQLYIYAKKHGGTCVVELKSREFRVKWIAQQLLQDAHDTNHAPWFKALANMAYIRQKCEAMTAAEVDGVRGQVGIIFGKHVRGRGARVAHAQAITRTWPAELRSAVRVW